MKRVPSRARRRRGRPANKEERARRGARRACSGSAAKASHRSRYCTNMVRTIAEGNARKGSQAVLHITMLLTRQFRPVSALLGRRGRGWPHAPDLDDGLLALGAVVVDLVRVV